MYYVDTETCGLYGLPVLLQYAQNDGPIHLWEFWRNPISDSLQLIESLLEDDICGFNLAFDAFHLYKIWTVFSRFEDHSAYPEDIVDELGILEEKARFSQFVIKPKRCLDIMLHARKGPFQSLMARDDIKIRRVPTQLAWQLAQELERRIKFADIYFANAKDKLAPKWKVYDILKPNGDINPDFKDIKLKFKASGSLKNLYRHAFKEAPKFTFREIEVNRKFWPVEYGYAPFALAVAPRYLLTKDWKGAWPEVIKFHIRHWGYNEEARQYASDDIKFTRRLATEYFDNPEPGDNDSELAWAVACCRWKGFAINPRRIRKLKQIAAGKAKKAPRDHRKVKEYVMQDMDDIEKIALQGSTKKTILKDISEWIGNDSKIHPAAIKAKNVLDAREATKEEEIYDKFLHALRFHASFVVIGTLSSRMAGADGLNPQGIKHQTYVRKAFPLADNSDECFKLIAERLGITPEEAKDQYEMVLCGGDFQSFEVTLAAKVFDDPVLNERLIAGDKVHCLMGMELFPGTTYRDIVLSKGKTPDMYDTGKKGFFLMCYGGQAYTFHTKLGIPMEIAEKAEINFNNKFKRVGAFGKWVEQEFGSLSQVGGLGSKIEYREPRDYAESFLGFKRFFTLENKIVKVLYEMAQRPPEHFKTVQIKVIRNPLKGVQTGSGAVQSALYAAAFGICSGIIRAAKNHYIQSPGAEITKATQVAIWKIQPQGVHKWLVQPMNIHDEIMCPTRRGYEEIVEEKVRETVGYYKEKYVPLLGIDWITDIRNWAGKTSRALPKVGT